MRLPGWVVALGCLAPFLGFWSYGLFDLDEGFYAAVTSDMLRRGDWVTPTYNGTPWFEKPILAYWLAMPSVALFGEGVGPRLPSVLCTLGLAWLLYRWGRREHGDLAGQLAALAYCGSLLPAGLGRMMMTDAPLALALAGGMYSLRWVADSPNRRSAAAGACVGLAVLAKGPVGLVLFGLVWGILRFVPRLRAGPGGLRWMPFLAVFAAVVSAWYVPCYLANGQVFVQQFLVEQNVGRFAGGDRAHAAPWWSHPFYFPAVLAVGMLPFWPFAARRLFRPEGEGGRFLAVWCLAVVGFFSVSLTKLPHYVLPAAAPVALAVGSALAVRVGSGSRWAVPAMLCWSLLLGAGATSGLHAYWRQGTAEVQEMARRARSRPGGLVVYRIGREGGPGTGGLAVQQTSHPSVLFYYGGPARLADDEAALRAEPVPFSVITRKGRWSPPGWQAEHVAGEQYDWYYVTSR